jgi:hypothetical protein
MRGIEIRMVDAFTIIKPTAPSNERNTKLEGNETGPIPLETH